MRDTLTTNPKISDTLNHMKQVYSSHRELAHVWANLSEIECNAGVTGRASNCRFSGPAFYSYATVIARHVWHAGRRCVVINSRSYSNSTAKHHSHIRRALSAQNGPQFALETGGMGTQLDVSGRAIREQYLASAVEQYGKSTRARTYKESHFRWAVECMQKANETAAFFGLRFAPLAIETEAQQLDALLSLGVKIKKETDAQRRKAEKARREREAAETACREKRNAILAQYAPAALTRWRVRVESDSLAESATAVLGSRVSESELLDYAANAGRFEETAAALRLSEDCTRVETSRGAQVLVRTVRFLWAYCSTAKATAKAVPAETLARFPRLDHYSCNEIDAAGNVRAGCHFLPFVEIEGIARALGLPPFNGEPAEVPAIPAEEVTA